MPAASHNRLEGDDGWPMPGRPGAGLAITRLERRGEIARFGLRAMIAGNLAAFMSASLAGMLV